MAQDDAGMESDPGGAAALTRSGFSEVEKAFKCLTRGRISRERYLPARNGPRHAAKDKTSSTLFLPPSPKAKGGGRMEASDSPGLPCTYWSLPCAPSPCPRVALSPSPPPVRYLNNKSPWSTQQGSFQAYRSQRVCITQPAGSNYITTAGSVSLAGLLLLPTRSYQRLVYHD
jgi:hypothetical protein